METQYCEKCGFPAEYCEYNPRCAKESKEKELKKIEVLKKKVQGNKCVTIVRNLDAHVGGEIKELAKVFSKKIACGSSIVRNGSGTDDVVIQTAEVDKVLSILESIKGITREMIVDTEKKKQPI
jgi:translation initiation factor 1 (eIF-1/SUI1)